MKYLKPIIQAICLLAVFWLFLTVHSLKRDVKKLKEVYTDTVTVTTYTTDPRQTDSSPYVTASGFKLNRKNPKKHRIIAISRDLKAKLKFGDKVRIIGAGKHDGEYYVHDVMNKRFKNRIDILINPKDQPTMYRNVKLIAI